MLKTLFNFLLMIVGNSIFYYALFKLSDWSGTLAIHYPVLHISPMRLEWFQLIKFESLVAYVVGFSLVSTFTIFFIGGLIFNWAYLAEGLKYHQNLFFPQFLVWCATPVAFVGMNWIYYGRLPDSRMIVAFLFLIAAQLVMRWK